jgi:hypothetical protein
MESPNVAAAGAGLDAGGWAHRVEVGCLVLFPLLFLVFAGTDLHPNPSGETAADQVRAVAESAGAWQAVHLMLAGASLLGAGAVLALRSLVPTRRSRLGVTASIAAALGVAAAGLVAGIVVMEAALVAPVAKACAASSSCLSLDNEPFLSEFANAAWNDLAHLSFAAGTLIFALATLAVRRRQVRTHLCARRQCQHRLPDGEEQPSWMTGEKRPAAGFGASGGSTRSWASTWP